ncbi:sigma-54-dependent transcriptional regulator [Desulfolithobacter sp.]
MVADTLLIVDDETDLLAGLKRLAASSLDCEVLTADCGHKALTLLQSMDIQIVLSDIRMPDMDGMALLERIKNEFPGTDVILMTAYGTIDQAVKALQQGAYDFITKPLNHQQLFHIIGNCLERRHLLQKNVNLERQIKAQRETGRFIGQSPALAQVLSVIKLVAASNISVLITGQSGTGKELAAKTIHRLSDRSDREMIAVNCPALPEAVLESELFGHKKGAFTGADTDHPGLFAAADGSTLFLDEIGDLPLGLQTKLLRVLQEREIRPVGGTRTRRIDVRIIASTNQDLQEKMRQGQFREDLYYRLSEITLQMPPLCSMCEDIPLLAEHFLNHYCREQNREPKTLSPEAVRQLCQARWPGNVRELQNTIKRTVLLAPGPVIQPQDLALEDNPCTCGEDDMEALLNMDYRSAKNQALRLFSTRYLTRLLKRTGGNVSQAARECGLERQSLQHLLRKYNISAQQFRTARS